MENNLFFIGIKCTLEQLSECVFVTEEDGKEYVDYYNFWDNIVFIWYNQDTHLYTIKEIVDKEVKYSYFEEDKNFIKYLNENKIQCVYDDNPLGQIFQSYSAAFLEIIRWAADVAWTKNKLEKLLEG